MCARTCTSWVKACGSKDRHWVPSLITVQHILIRGLSGSIELTDWPLLAEQWAPKDHCSLLSVFRQELLSWVQVGLGCQNSSLHACRHFTSWATSLSLVELFVSKKLQINKQLPKGQSVPVVLLLQFSRWQHGKLVQYHPQDPGVVLGDRGLSPWAVFLVHLRLCFLLLLLEWHDFP